MDEVVIVEAEDEAEDQDEKPELTLKQEVSRKNSIIQQAEAPIMLGELADVVVAMQLGRVGDPIEVGDMDLHLHRNLSSKRKIDSQQRISPLCKK